MTAARPFLSLVLALVAVLLFCAGMRDAVAAGPITGLIAVIEMLGALSAACYVHHLQEDEG